MKIAVTGSKGRLGSFLVERYGYCPLVCDITNPKQVNNTVSKIKPDVIINCAAKTNVDWCETNKDEATEVNFFGVKNLRKSFGGRLIQISTDFVFDGTKGNYKETDDPNPINHYGFTKYAAEIYLEIGWQDFPTDTIIRTSALYGNPKFDDIVRRIFEKLEDGMEIHESAEIIISPTHVKHLGEAIDWIVNNKERIPLIHVACKNPISRLEFARQVEKHSGDWSDDMISDDSWNPIAKRPKNNGLNTEKAQVLGIPLYYFGEGLDIYEY